MIKSKFCRKRSKFPMQFCSGLLCNIPSILRLSSPDIARAKKHSAYITCVPFLHTLILKNEEQPSVKKIQSNLSQVIKQSPHAKIYAFLRQFFFPPKSSLRVNMLLDFLYFFSILSSLVSSPAWEHCIVFLSKTLNSYYLFPLRWVNRYWKI